MKRPNGYWTKERVFEESKKYETKNEFQKGCVGAYTVARKNGWLSEMTWSKELLKPKGYWSKENVFKEAKKYKKRGDFAIGCSSAYNVARRYNLLDELFPKKCVASNNILFIKFQFLFSSLINFLFLVDIYL